MRFKPRFSAILYKYFSRQKAVVVMRKVADVLRFVCGQYGFFTVFAVYCRVLPFSAVVEPQKTAAWAALRCAKCTFLFSLEVRRCIVNRWQFCPQYFEMCSAVEKEEVEGDKGIFLFFIIVLGIRFVSSSLRCYRPQLYGWFTILWNSNLPFPFSHWVTLFPRGWDSVPLYPDVAFFQ